jgi:hypothetical protein
LQEAVDDELGDDVHDADIEPERAPRRSVLDRVDHLATEREDLVGVPIHDAAHVGQRQLSADLREELLAQAVLERMDLRAQGRVREPQHLPRGDEAPFTSDDPEIEEVVVVEPFHGSCICRQS